MPVVVPDWADDNDWAAASPRGAGDFWRASGTGDLRSWDELPAVFTNDEHRPRYALLSGMGE